MIMKFGRKLIALFKIAPKDTLLDASTLKRILECKFTECCAFSHNVLSSSSSEDGVSDVNSDLNKLKNALPKLEHQMAIMKTRVDEIVSENECLKNDLANAQLVVQKINAEQNLLKRQTNHCINEQIALLLNALKPQPSQFPSGCMKPMKNLPNMMEFHNILSFCSQPCQFYSLKH